MIGSGDEKTFKCGACGKSSIIKNNGAVVEEYRRLRRRFRAEPPPPDFCQNEGCDNHQVRLSQSPGLYRKSGRTATGTQRYKCKACLRTFTVGSRIRKQHRSSTNGDVLWMITNGMPISKISDFTGLCPRDVYRKIDFIYDRVLDHTARREGSFASVDWSKVGRRFATDSQTLHLNWPNKKTRAQIAVQHLCTAHANTGYIMAGHLGLDPGVELPDIEAQMSAAGDFDLPRAFRSQARVWSETEFKAHLDKMTNDVEIHPQEAPDVDFGLQLPHRGSLLRQDVSQLAHAFLLRHFLGKGDDRFIFVLDADPGLALSFVSAFAPRIKVGRADVIVVHFNKNKSNDERNMLVGDGKAALELATGITQRAWAALKLEEKLQRTDTAIEGLLHGHLLGEPFAWPFHTKSEPHRRIRILTDRPDMAPDRRARLMRLATLRSVDSYFHKVRSNIRFAARPAHTPSGNGRAWDRHYLYNPETMVKIIEIYRFVHNWIGSSKTKETPAMKLGLARGKMRLTEFFE
ncbi:transposase [Pseudooceanicola sp.]|uniref:transposase n=1 Tax=Pseudooceanicola sp. TaxID=1914328 RepID=UPI004058F6EA